MEVNLHAVWEVPGVINKEKHNRGAVHVDPGLELSVKISGEDS